MSRNAGPAVDKITNVSAKGVPTCWQFLLKLLDYYEGTQNHSYMHPELVRQVVINWPRLVVDALEERIDPQGFPRWPCWGNGPTKHCRTYHPELSYEADSEFTSNGSRHSDRTRRVRDRERSAPTPKAL